MHEHISRGGNWPINIENQFNHGVPLKSGVIEKYTYNLIFGIVTLNDHLSYFFIFRQRVSPGDRGDIVAGSVPWQLLISTYRHDGGCISVTSQWMISTWISWWTHLRTTVALRYAMWARVTSCWCCCRTCRIRQIFTSHLKTAVRNMALCLEDGIKSLYQVFVYSVSSVISWTF